MLLNDANNIYVGKVPIKKVCVGNKNIWIKKNYSLKDFLKAFNDFGIRDDENFNKSLINYPAAGCTISRDVLGGGNSDELNDFPIVGFRITNNPINPVPFLVTITVNEENVTENTPKLSMEFTGTKMTIKENTFRNIIPRLYQIDRNAFCYRERFKKLIPLNNIKIKFQVYSYQGWVWGFYKILDYVNIELLTVEDRAIQRFLNS